MAKYPLHSLDHPTRSPSLRNLSKVLVLLAVLLVASQLMAKPSNKWRIKFNHEAKSSGEIVFSVEPIGMEPIEVHAQIEEGMGENKVAKVVRDAFRAQLPKERFHVERDDGEDVLVKRRRGEVNFDLHLKNSSVENLQIKLKRE